MKKTSSNKSAPSPSAAPDAPRRLRAKTFYGLLGVSRSTFYQGLRRDRYPRPDGYDGSMPFWYYASVRRLFGAD